MKYKKTAQFSQIHLYLVREVNKQSVKGGQYEVGNFKLPPMWKKRRKKLFCCALAIVLWLHGEIIIIQRHKAQKRAELVQIFCQGNSATTLCNLLPALTAVNFLWDFLKSKLQSGLLEQFGQQGNLHNRIVRIIEAHQLSPPVTLQIRIRQTVVTESV